MLSRMLSRSGFAVALAGLLLPLGLGCGADDGIGKRYPVSGKVTYKGQPVPKGTVSFLPEGGDESARPAAGTITDGEYTVSTMGDRDGALPGKYTVTVVAKDVDESKLVIPKFAGQPTPESRRKAARSAKSLVPPKYSLPQTSGLHYEVKAETNQADFDLNG